MSDTHTMHESIPFDKVVAQCDPARTVILHSGDWTSWPNWRVTAAFNTWMAGGNAFLAAVPRERKIACPGNHDDGWEKCFPRVDGRPPSGAAAALSFVLLANASTVVRIGDDVVLNVHGTTYARPAVDSIPADCDILLTHAPARRIDRLHDPSIAAAVASLPPPPHLRRRVHVSGHAHERHFVEEAEQLHTTFIGAALARSSSSPLRSPIIYSPVLR
jgi:hypothetical protein